MVLGAIALELIGVNVYNAKCDIAACLAVIASSKEAIK